MGWRRWLILAAALVATFAAPARAELVVGVTLSLSGPAAPVGRAQQRVVDHLPRQLAGQPVRYVVRDDGSEPANAAVLAAALVTQEGADLVIGSTTVAATLAMAPVLAAHGVALVTPAAVAPDGLDPASARWLFRTAPDLRLMANAVVAHMHGAGVRRVAFIGPANAYGAGWWQLFEPLAGVRGIQVVADAWPGREAGAHARAAARVHAAKPEAVLVAEAGQGAVDMLAALRQAGFTGAAYLTHAVAIEGFAERCGPPCEGAVLPATPAWLAALPEAPAAARQAAAALGRTAVTSFEGGVWDAGRLLAQALPRAAAAGSPGSPAFRQALRDAIETAPPVAGANGIYRFSGRDHAGLDQRAVMMGRLRQGRWEAAR
jgi:branched-chain amino acid transport system substrate-binding protein